MYPIKQCIDLAAENQHWHGDLVDDPPYARSVSSIAQIYFDMLRSQDKRLRKLWHVNYSIRSLRKQLVDPNLVVTDSLIFLVVALALISEASNEVEDALAHMRGLDAIIAMRGGISALARKRSLQIKCCRSVTSSILFTWLLAHCGQT
jgi:hypothetical protein